MGLHFNVVNTYFCLLSTSTELLGRGTSENKTNGHLYLIDCRRLPTIHITPTPETFYLLSPPRHIDSDSTHQVVMFVLTCGGRKYPVTYIYTCLYSVERRHMLQVCHVSNRPTVSNDGRRNDPNKRRVLQQRYLILFLSHRTPECKSFHVSFLC